MCYNEKTIYVYRQFRGSKKREKNPNRVNEEYLTKNYYKIQFEVKSMEKYNREELKEALEAIASAINESEKIHPKFPEGTSQHTLLRNRIKALYISKALIGEENIVDKYTEEELREALPPVTSLMSKCEKAHQKFQEGTYHHTRLKKIIKAMYISKALIEEELSKRG